jgi:hypothetical protein
VVDFKFDLDVSVKELQKLYERRGQIRAMLEGTEREIVGKEFLVNYLQSKVQEEENGKKEEDKQGS